MKTELFNDLEKLLEKETINKVDVQNILRKYANTIGIYDQMIACQSLKADNQYVQAEYAEKFDAVYIKHFIMRISDIQANKKQYTEKIDKEDLKEAIKLFKYNFDEDSANRSENDKFPFIYILISMYTTFITEEPIHPEGTPFPGNLKVIKENNKYLCPVKDAQLESPNAVCKICIAENLDHRQNI